MGCNGFGFTCEAVIRDLLPQVGIPHKNRKGSGEDWYWWATQFEDRALGVDCWVTLGYREFAVDFTVISGAEQMTEKTAMALGRGVIPVFLPQRMLWEAEEGDERALAGLGIEIRAQICLKQKLLNGNKMTRELALAAGHTKVLCPAGA